MDPDAKHLPADAFGAGMAVTDFIAGYAAVVGTLSLGWQVLSRRRAMAPGVEVTVSNALVPVSVTSSEWQVCITAVNAAGERPVEITGFGFEMQDQTGATWVPIRIGPLDTIPGTVAPHHRLVAYAAVPALERSGIDLKRPLVGFVHLATGGKVSSEPTTLRS